MSAAPQVDQTGDRRDLCALPDGVSEIVCPKKQGVIGAGRCVEKQREGCSCDKAPVALRVIVDGLRQDIKRCGVDEKLARVRMVSELRDLERLAEETGVDVAPAPKLKIVLPVRGPAGKRVPLFVSKAPIVLAHPPLAPKLPKETNVKRRRSDLIVMTGAKVGLWTVLGPAPSRTYRKGGRHAAWLCRCVCGQERVVLGGHLRRASGVRGCGCGNARVGDKYGTRTLIAPGFQKHAWKWKCDCGATGETKAVVLRMQRCRFCLKGSDLPHAKPVMFRGELVTMADLGRRFGMSRGVLHHRVRLGWSLEEAVSTPTRSIAR